MDSASQLGIGVEVLLIGIEPTVEPSGQIGRRSVEVNDYVIPAEIAEANGEIAVPQESWLESENSVRTHVDRNHAVLVVLQVIDTGDVLE